MSNVKMHRLLEVMDFDSDTSNFSIDFSKMTKRYGLEFMEFCIAAYQANGGSQTDEEFRKMNCDMPKGYFEMIKKKAG